MTLGERLRLIRKHRKLTQEELGEAIGYNQSRVSAWESGKDNIYADQLGLLAKALGVTADVLLDVENDRPPTDGEIQLLSEARRIGFDAAWRTLIKHGEPAKKLESLEDSGGED